MLYRLFLYSTTAVTGAAPAIEIVNADVSTNTQSGWGRNCAADYICEFDYDAVIREIEKEILDPASKVCKCRPILQYPPRESKKVGYIFIATSYAKAAEVLPRIHASAT